MRRFRVLVAGTCAVVVGLLFLTVANGRTRAASTSHACGQLNYAKNGVVYHVLFAKNGSVQQYLLARSSHNTEQDHDVLKAVTAHYGPEAVNAPPLRIISFRPGSGGLMIPDKAIDSCGRITHFH